MNTFAQRVVAVSGATGLIGAEVAAALSSACRVRSVGRRDGCDAHVDLRCSDSIRRLDLTGVSAFVHAAGVTDEELRENPIAALGRSTVALEALLQRCIAHGVQRFIYISSSHVYGALRGRICESSPADPLSLYAICHYAAEQTIKRFVQTGALRALILWPNAVFGVPRYADFFQRWSLIPYAFAREACEHGRITLKTAGVQRRNFVSTRDIARCVNTYILQAEVPEWWRVNPVGPDTLSVKAFASLCAQLCEDIKKRPCTVIWASEQLDLGTEDFTYESEFELGQGNESVIKGMREMLRWMLKREEAAHDRIHGV